MGRLPLRERPVLAVAALAVSLAAVSACALNPRVSPEDCDLGTLVEVENKGSYRAQVFLVDGDTDPTFLGVVEPGRTEVFSVGSGRAWVRLSTEDGRRASAAAQRLGGGVVVEYRCR